MSCGKTQEFLAKSGVASGEQVDAKKTVLGKAHALAMLKNADRVYIAKGKNMVHFDMKKDKPDPETVVPLMLGPTGNLRAPALRVGRTLLIGFHEDAYRSVLS